MDPPNNHDDSGRVQLLEEDYRHLWATSVNAVLVTDEQWRISLANPACLKVFGYSPEELVGQNIEVLQPAGEQARDEAGGRWLRPGAQEPFDSNPREAVGLHRGGYEFPIEIALTRLSQDDRAIHVAFIRDVTERKAAEQAEKESEERYRVFAENFPGGNTAVLDKDLRITFIEGQDAKTYGPMETFIGKLLHEVAPPETCAAVEANLRRAFEGETVTYETNYKGGTRYRARATPLFSKDGAINEVMVVAVNIPEEERAQEALRESEQQMRLFMEATADCLWKWDLIGGKVVRSVGFNRVFGYAMEEVDSNITWWEERLHPDDRAKVLSTFQDTMARGGNACSYEYRFRCKDGTFAAIHDRAYIVRDARGKPLRALGAMTDITERRRAEEELKREKEILAKIFNNIPVMIGFVGTDGSVSLVNPEWERTIGWTLKELRNQNVDIFAEAYPDPSYRDKVLDFVAAATGEWADLKIKVRDGHVIDAVCAVVHLSDGTKVAIAQDITAQKRAQEVLRESEERFRLLAEVTNDAIWDWDLITNDLWWNEGFETLFGYSRAEIEKTIDSWSNRVHPAERGRVISGLHRMIDEGGTTWSDEYRFLCKNGTYAYVLDRGHVIRKADGKPVRMVGGMRDLTERSKAEEASQAFPAELLRAQDDERRRIARELHDSTAQELAVVAMNLSRLEEWIEGRNPWAENLLADSLAVLNEGNRDLRTLAHLLHPPMLEELGLIGALRDYVEGFSARSGVEVEFEFAEDFERCPEQIETALFRVVQESLSNVHRHSESKFARVTLARVRDTIELTVADRGRGLPAGLLIGAAEHARVGVGISGMRQRMAQLRGRLEISSNETGTTVRAILPFCPRGTSR